jgi:hypothetical protein
LFLIFTLQWDRAIAAGRWHHPENKPGSKQEGVICASCELEAVAIGIARFSLPMMTNQLCGFAGIVISPLINAMATDYKSSEGITRR